MLWASPKHPSNLAAAISPTKVVRAAALLPLEAPLSEPAFNPQDRVEYRWAAGGPFVGEARVIEVLPDGRYRLERLAGAPFPKEGSIFAEEQLQLKPLSQSDPSVGRRIKLDPPLPDVG